MKADTVVWVVERYIQNEGGDVIGVVAKPEDAQAVVDAYEWGGDGFYATPWRVGEGIQRPRSLADVESGAAPRPLELFKGGGR